MIDLRSDTVTRPTPEMLETMLSANTGDDVYGEDPTVNELEQLAATMTGKQAALFAASGTQTNLLALMSHCQRGDEYIAGQSAHTYLYEAGGGAVLGGLQPCPIAFNQAGELPLEDIFKAIKPDDFHFAQTKLVCLENTQSGKVLSLDYLNKYSKLASEHGLNRHLDGARVFNAAVKLNCPVIDICQYFDSVSICLSKGLACPIGSILVGDEAFIARARRLRKMLGGGMRQAGILAAAGIYALNNNINRLSQDHDNTMKIAESLEHMGIGIEGSVETNMLFLDGSTDLQSLQQHLQSVNIKISGNRWVFHQDISEPDLETIIDACQSYVNASS